MKKLYMLLAAVLIMVIAGCSSSTDPHTVTYDANGGTGGIPSDSNNYLVGAEVTVKSNGTLTNAGYTFTCWNTQANGTGTDRAPAATFAIGSANVILYAKWTALSSAKVITAFSFATPAATGTITEATHTIAVTVPDGTNVTALVPTITHTGASISPDTGVAHDFTSAAKYTVTAADASIQAYTVTLKYGYLSGNIGTLKYVPAGSFQRDGTTANISTITTAFRTSQHEITRAQFLVVMGTGTDPSNATYSTGMTDPVQMTNWYHAIAFCNKLSIAEGFTRVYDVAGFTTDQDWINLAFGSIPTSADATWNLASATWTNTGYRLPTEMEWEWAAMGATMGFGWASPTYLTGYGKQFAGSDSILADGSGGTHVIGDYAWTSGNSSGKTHPVGTTGTTGNANELGLYDMSGNVWEWVWDWYATPSYTTGTLTDDKGAVSGTYRVLRGGSWLHDASSATVAYRNYYYPDHQYNNYGFRVVRP